MTHWIRAAFRHNKEKSKQLIETFVTPAIRLLSIHDETFDHEELKPLTFPIGYEELHRDSDGRRAAIMKNLDVPQIEGSTKVMDMLASSNNEVVGNPQQGFISKMEAIKALGEIKPYMQEELKHHRLQKQRSAGGSLFKFGDTKA
jgi:hypothetical protein